MNSELWYNNHQNLADLWRFLEAVGVEPEDTGYFLEKPWKWEPERKIMLENLDWENYDREQMDELQDLIIEDQSDIRGPDDA